LICRLDGGCGWDQGKRHRRQNDGARATERDGRYPMRARA
jgi:hypothetical protein